VVRALLDIEAAIRAAGFSPRGALMTLDEERVGLLAGVRMIVLVGVVGARNWSAFESSPEFGGGGPDPLDRFSTRIVGRLAGDLGATALFPFGGPPYLPFQRWAMRAEPVAQSPLGLLIHPDYGLWHSFRGALGFAEAIEIPEVAKAASPCESCEARPCLSACPVGAFSPGRYDVEACAAHLRSVEGNSCVSGGCRARRACPVGHGFSYAREQAAFHMAAFLHSRAV
jgi:hypothetical protein